MHMVAVVAVCRNALGGTGWFNSGSALAEKVGQGEGDGVTRRVISTWWLLCLPVEMS